MTKTQRRIKADVGSTAKAATEPGVKYTCDSCLMDITHTVRIQCAAPECEEVDLCPNCFSEGKEVQYHKAWHDYKIVETHSVPIFAEDWGADEELLLITGLELFGLGNWQEVAEHVGTRFKEECERHYMETYLNERSVKRNFMPRMTSKVEITREEFQSRKKRRIEDMRKPHALPLHATEQAKGSAPNNHEIAGYMPARLEFEHEEENEAEMVIRDMEFGLVMGYGGSDQPEAPAKTDPPDKVDLRPPPTVSSKAPSATAKGLKTGAPASAEKGISVPIDIDKEDADGNAVIKVEEPEPEAEPEPDQEAEQGDKADEQAVALPPMDVEHPEEIELKLALLDIYYAKLDRRTEVKDFLFDRNLMAYKANRALDNKRSKEDKEVHQRYKVFAKLQTAQDFEVLVEGLIYEQALRKQISILQEYRRQGITTASDAARFEKEKVNRAGGYRDRQQAPREFMTASDRQLARGTPQETGRSGAKASKSAANGNSTSEAGLVATAPPSLVYADSFGLLTYAEQQLCSDIKILPRPYLLIKDTMVRENARRGGLLERKDASRIFAIEERKAERIFDFLTTNGILFRPIASQPLPHDPQPLEVPPL